MCNVYFESLYPQKAKGNIEKKKKKDQTLQ